ncbi:MAG: hypothetical protein KDA69_05930, partial [Planctomycetaceae bacterium]|nr:hypothetical protein [Planctomycetaceae bacterium]
MIPIERLGTWICCMMLDFVGSVMSPLLIRTIVLSLCLVAVRQTSGAPIDFERDIQPILQAKCVNCHGTEEREGGLRLLGRRDILSRNDSGSVAVTPGKSTESELFRRVASSDETERMPPEGTPLNAEQIDLVKQWIDEGAVWPEGAKTTHWAYVPPQKAELPEVSDPQWIQNPIDAYVLAR